MRSSDRMQVSVKARESESERLRASEIGRSGEQERSFHQLTALTQGVGLLRFDRAYCSRIRQHEGVVLTS